MVEKFTLTFSRELRPVFLKAWFLDHFQNHLDAVKNAGKFLGPILPGSLFLATQECVFFTISPGYTHRAIRADDAKLEVAKA